jgi:hypothetical protein
VVFAVAKLFPEERDGPALEGKEEEEVHAVYLNDDQGDPENDAVSSLNDDTQQEDADAEFEENACRNLCRFARPPPLIQVVSVVNIL